MRATRRPAAWTAQVRPSMKLSPARPGMCRRHPWEPGLCERLGTLYILTHSRIEAGQIGAAWRRVQPEAAGPHWLLGRVAFGNHQVEEAIRQFEAAVARDPNDAEYAISLG